MHGKNISPRSYGLLNEAPGATCGILFHELLVKEASDPHPTAWDTVGVLHQDQKVSFHC